MKTLLSSGIAGSFLLGLLACAGSDSGDGDPVAAAQPIAAFPAATPDAPALDVAPPAPEVLGPVAPTPEDTPEDATPVGFLGEPSTEPASALPVASAPLDWRPCGQFADRNIECAELAVPIDYAQPDGEQLTLALRRVLADPLQPHRGALLFNPGGPGGRGIDIALSAFEAGRFDAVAPGFDIIGFDPRGVAQSGERGCGIEAPDLYSGVDTDAQVSLQDLVDAKRAEGEDCEREWGLLFRKLGSNNVVKDMEEIRKALREPVLNFYGASYGTRLGALYAHEYPETTGRIVLDAPVSPRSSFVELMRDQFYGALDVHERLLAQCEDGTLTCTPNARQRFDQVVANAQARGLAGQFASTWLGALSAPANIPGLLSALAAEAADPGGEWITSFLAGGRDGKEGDVAFASVSCSDDSLEPPTLEQLERLAAELVQASPVFGPGRAGIMTLCAGWPTTRDPVPLLTARNAPPVLVIGGLIDSRTPYHFAQELTEALGNATLLTSAHWGHVALANGGDCVLNTIRAYLTSGSMPPTAALCQ